ncbi:hypothetical protein JCM10207_008782 [Rhodosporidiobolus poonsookiae]
MTDLWLKADYPLGPFAQPPPDQAVADVLAKLPWSGYLGTGAVGFMYDFVDRPEAGTALLAMLNPPTRPTPPDGLRYFYAEPNERRTTTQHVVAVPSSPQNPTHSTRITVELECFTACCGHLPTVSPSQPIAPDSPEMRLTRFRKRWRVANGQYQNLWFYWWGQDGTGGTGAGPAPPAPQGWDRMPARAYPLVKPPNVPTTPIYPFPSPNRAPSAAAPATPQAAARPPALLPNAPTAGLTPQQVAQLAASGNPYARQQQLAALASHTPLGMSTSNPALEARQQQFQAQQAQQALAMQQGRAGAYPADPRLAGAQGYPYGLTPQQVQQAQAQQALLAQQNSSASSAAAAAATAAVRARKPVAPAVAPAAAAPAPAPTAQAVPPQYEAETPLCDIFDLLTPRQLAIHRYASNHDAVSLLFSPWPASEIVSGGPRAREVDELVKLGGLSSRTGEPRVGVVPGLGRDGALALLGTSAARIAAYGAAGKELGKATAGLTTEERRKRLEQLRSELEAQTDELERRFGEQEAKVRAATASAA